MQDSGGAGVAYLQSGHAYAVWGGRGSGAVAQVDAVQQGERGRETFEAHVVQLPPQLHA